VIENKEIQVIQPSKMKPQQQIVIVDDSDEANLHDSSLYSPQIANLEDFGEGSVEDQMEDSLDLGDRIDEKAQFFISEEEEEESEDYAYDKVRIRNQNAEYYMSENESQKDKIQSLFFINEYENDDGYERDRVQAQFFISEEEEEEYEDQRGRIRNQNAEYLISERIEETEGQKDKIQSPLFISEYDDDGYERDRVQAQFFISKEEYEDQRGRFQNLFISEKEEDEEFRDNRIQYQPRREGDMHLNDRKWTRLGDKKQMQDVNEYQYENNEEKMYQNRVRYPLEYSDFRGNVGDHVETNNGLYSEDENEEYENYEELSKFL
jgi:hypothetical protein